MKILIRLPSKTWRGNRVSRTPKEKLSVCFSRANSCGLVSNGEIFRTANRRRRERGAGGGGRGRGREGDERDKAEKEKGAATACCQQFLRNFRH